MAVLSNLVVNGSGRILNKLYVNILDVVGSASFDGISTGSLTVSGSTSFSGDVTIADNKTLYLQNASQDIGYNVDRNVALIIGDRNGEHLAFDKNEIMAKASGTGYGTLYLNNDGGIVEIGSGSNTVPKIVVNNGTISGNIASFKQINSDNATISNKLSSSMITATNLNVADTLRATKFDLQHISQSGGSLYISPTIKFPNAGTTVVVAKDGNYITIKISDSSITSNNMAGTIWDNNSYVKCSGTIGGVVTGTMDGTILQVNKDSNFIQIKVKGENSASVVAGTYSASQVKDLSVMIYKRKVTSGSDTFEYPIGLWLSCYDIENNSCAIRIYGGSSSQKSPNVYLGNLSGAGLPNVNTSTPTGWGLYADNAYLKGTIVSTSGLIGGWTIGSNYLLTGTWGEENGLLLSSSGSVGSKDIGGSGDINNWVFTADKHFGVTKTGVLYANDAHISGNITASGGMIAGFHIVGGVTNNTKSSAQGGYAYTNSLYRHATDATYDYEVGMRGSSNETANATDGSTNLAFYVTRVPKGSAWTGGESGNRHDVFYINHRGDLYCENVVAKGGSIGGCNIVSGQLQVDSAHITSVNASKINTGTLSASVIGARSINASKLAITDINNYVTVTESDPNTAIVGNHMYGSGANALVQDGYIVKQTASAQCIVLCPYTANNFKDGDQLRYTITLKGATAGSGVVRINYLNADKTYSNGNYNNGPTLQITTSEQTFTGVIKIVSNANNYTFNVADRAYFTLAIYDYHAEGSRTQFYLKNASIYKMNGGELIIDGTITGDKIQANTIKASKLVLSDPTNYVTVNESNPDSAIVENHPFGSGGNNLISGGYIQKVTDENQYLALTNFTQNSLAEDDELYYSFIIHSASACKAKILIYFYNEQSSSTYQTNIGSSELSITTTNTAFAGTLKITEAAANSGYYAICIAGTSTPYCQLYVKNISIRKKSGGNLIVDGAITAGKISVGAITAEKLDADAITVSSRNLLIGTRNSMSYAVDSTTNANGNYTVKAFYYFYNNLQLQQLGVKTGDKLTLAFDWETSNQNTYGTFRVEFYGYQDASNPDKYRAAFGNVPLVTTSASNKSGHVVVTGTVTSTMLTATNVRIRFDATILTFKVSRMSLTLSNREVDWSPSPYEVGGFQIDADSIHTINKDITLSEANSICLSSTDFAREIDTTNRTNLRFAIGRYFGVSNDGVIYASNAVLTGNITAKSGKIGNFNISTSADYSASGHYFTNSLYTQMDDKTDATKCYEAGMQCGGDSTSVVFYVRQKPKADAWNASNSGQWNFYVLKNGKMKCNNAEIEGHIIAKTGEIGGFHIANSSNTGTSANGGHIYANSLYRHSGDGTTYEYEFGMKGDADENPSSASTEGGNLAFYVRRIAKGAAWTGAENMFYVTHDGRMLCTNATITGKVNSTSGSIGGWTINSTQFYTVTPVTAGVQSTQYGLFFSKATSNTTSIFQAGSRTYDGSTYGSWSMKTYLRADGYFGTKSGNIAGWNITSERIYKAMDGYKVALFAPTSPTTSNAAFYVATLEGTTEKTWPFIVKYDGSLISTKGKIANWIIDSTSIRTGEKTAVSSGAVTLSSADFTRTINDIPRENLRFAIGGNFAVKNDGTLYCSKADISGKIKATEGEIGGCIIENGMLKVSQNNIVDRTDYADENLLIGTANPVTQISTIEDQYMCYTTYNSRPFSSFGYKKGRDSIVLSFDWEVKYPQISGKFYIYAYATNNDDLGDNGSNHALGNDNVNMVTFNSSNYSGHFSIVLSPSSTQSTRLLYDNDNAFAIDVMTNSGGTYYGYQYVTISNCILKIGNSDTGWKLSPFDNNMYTIDQFGIRNFSYMSPNLDGIFIISFEDFKRRILYSYDYPYSGGLPDYVNDIRLLVGDNFAVDKKGKLYCRDAVIGDCSTQRGILKLSSHVNVENIIFGGTNILSNTLHIQQFSFNSSVQNKYIEYYIGNSYTLGDFEIHSGLQFRFSCIFNLTLDQSGSSSINLRIYLSNSNDSKSVKLYESDIYEGKNNEHIYITWSVGDSTLNDYKQYSKIRISFSNNNGRTGTASFKHCMLYFGSTKTGYSPSPYDAINSNFKFYDVNSSNTSFYTGSMARYNATAQNGVCIESEGNIGVCKLNNNQYEYTQIAGGIIQSKFHFDSSNSDFAGDYYLNFKQGTGSTIFSLERGSTTIFRVDGDEKGKVYSKYFYGDCFSCIDVSNGNTSRNAFYVQYGNAVKFSVNYAGSLSYASDERYKNVISNLIENGVYKNIFMSLNPFAFTWNDINDSTIHFGVGAQTLQKILKDNNLVNTSLINDTNKDNLMVNYQELLMLSVPVVQEHETEIQKLKRKIESLEDEIQRLKEAR